MTSRSVDASAGHPLAVEGAQMAEIVGVDVVPGRLAHPGRGFESERGRDGRRLEEDVAVLPDEGDDVGRPFDQGPEASFAVGEGVFRTPEPVADPGHRFPHEHERGDDVESRRGTDRPEAPRCRQQRDHVGHGEQGQELERCPRRVAETEPDEDDHVEQAVDETVVGAVEAVDDDQGEGQGDQPQSGRPAPALPRDDPDHHPAGQGGHAVDHETGPVGPGRKGHQGPTGDDQDAAQEEQGRRDLTHQPGGEGAGVRPARRPTVPGPASARAEPGREPPAGAASVRRCHRPPRSREPSISYRPEWPGEPARWTDLVLPL